MLQKLTHNEILALLPKHAPPPLDQIFYRNLVNHWSRYGSPALVKKSGRGWVVDFAGHGHPCIWKTKRKAMEMADAWVLEVSRAGRHHP